MQAKLYKYSKQRGFTLVEIILVLVIMSIIMMMVTNPGLLRQRESVIASQISNNLLAFMDQRKLDMFLGKKLGDMLVEDITLNIDTNNPGSILSVNYNMIPSRTQKQFDKLLPQDTNLSYYFHYDAFRCVNEKAEHTQYELSCGYPENLTDFITTEIVLCDKNNIKLDSPEILTIALKDSEIQFGNDDSPVYIRIKSSYKGLFSRTIHWDRRTGVMYDLYASPDENLTCT